MNIRFAELPNVRTNRGGAWAEEAAALRANPGKWAHFEEYDERSASDKGSFANSIKKGRLQVFRDGEFEARVIKGQVWARFVGDAA